MKSILPITEILKNKDFNIEIDCYGKYIGKILNVSENNKNGKLILVTSTNPTPMGEGKTTLSIGLCDSLNKIGKNSIVCLREPSLGPVFGSKGGATGGGKAKIFPEENINLHFTGDFHAITSANNLLCAVIDNHIYYGNELKIKKVVFKRCLDMNDRELRKIKLNNRDENFVITPASEIMAILCLSKNIMDLKEKLGNIIIGYDEDDKEIYAKQLNCIDAMTILLKDAIKPNLVQTGYNNLAIIHGGPFANIAHGCNSYIATSTSMKISDYTITEAGFGSDMGALKFLDIKCRLNNIYPDVIVINSTIKSMKYNGNGNLKEGIKNLGFHIDLMKKFTKSVIVALNKFENDTCEEINFVKEFVQSKACEFEIATMYKDGEDGCINLANNVVKMADNKKNIYNVYSLDDSIFEKIEKICNLLGCTKINFSDEIEKKLKYIESSKFNKLPICISKTPMSITDNNKILGYPKGFEMTITDTNIQSGAGFIVIYMGNVITLPGLGEKPNFELMKLEDYIN